MPGATTDSIVGGSYQQTTGTTPLTWLLSNPTGSGMTAYVTKLKIWATHDCRVQFIIDPTVTGGTAKNATNLGGTYAPQATVKIGGSVSGGTQLDAEGYVTPGNPYIYDESAALTILEGHSVLVQVVPEARSYDKVSVTVLAHWREL